MANPNSDIQKKRLNPNLALYGSGIRLNILVGPKKHASIWLFGTDRLLLVLKIKTPWAVLFTTD